MTVRSPLYLSPTGVPTVVPVGDTLAGVGWAELSFGGGAVVSDGTWFFDLPYGATLATLFYEVGSAGGSFSVSVTNAGAAVGGLTSVSVSSATRASTAATSNAAVAGSAASPTRVALVVSGTTGTPTGAALMLLWSRT